LSSIVIAPRVMRVVHSEKYVLFRHSKNKLSLGIVSHQVCVYECVHLREFVVIPPGLHSVYLTRCLLKENTLFTFNEIMKSMDIDKQETFLKDQINLKVDRFVVCVHACFLEGFTESGMCVTRSGNIFRTGTIFNSNLQRI
jgi:hypothetical protein